MNLQARLENLFEILFPGEVLDFTKKIDNRVLENWDSIKYVMVALAVQEEFQLTLTQEEILEFSSFDKILQILILRGF